MPMIRVSEELKKRLESLEIGSMNRTVSGLLTYFDSNKANKSVLTSDDFEDIRQIVESAVEKLVR